tara:strand:+ start:190 stop:660 length:471 start_codon:yes stop_codon:yes gene_type:complete
MTGNKVLKDQNIEVIKEKMNTSSRKFSRYESDAFYIACVYIPVCAGVFLDMNILGILFACSWLPFIKIIVERLALKRPAIAMFKGDIIELVSLLNREGINLISSNNVYVFSSAKLSLIPQVSCIAKVVDEGIKISTEQFLLEKWVKNDGRITLINN